MTRRQAIALFVAALGPQGSASGEGARTSHSFQRTLMGTLFTIKTCHPDLEAARKAASAAFGVAEEINAVASDYIADSELLSLSKHPPGVAVALSPLLFSLLREAQAYAAGTDGCFDPTVGPLTRLWRESRRRKTLPDPETLAAARAATGWRHLLLDPERRTATFEKPGMRLDLGGIAKGQAADAMLEAMKEHGCPHSSITCGGDVRLGLAPPGQDGWKVGVRTFDKERDSQVLGLSETAVSTSGDLRQFVEIDGVRYSHLIDPATGLGLTRRTAATVVAPTAALSDALATACCIAPPERSRRMAAGLGATAVHLP